MKKSGFRVKIGFFGNLAIIDKVATLTQTALSASLVWRNSQETVDFINTETAMK